MMAISPKGNHISLARVQSALGLRGRLTPMAEGLKERGMGSVSLLAGAAGARLSDFPSRAAGAAVTHPGWVRAAPGSAASPKPIPEAAGLSPAAPFSCKRTGKSGRCLQLL